MFGPRVARSRCARKAWRFDWSWCPSIPSAGYSPRHPDVLRVNPKRQVPVLLDGDVELFNSTQIFEYLEDRCPEPALWPRTPPSARGHGGSSAASSTRMSPER